MFCEQYPGELDRKAADAFLDRCSDSPDWHSGVTHQEDMENKLTIRSKLFVSEDDDFVKQVIDLATQKLDRDLVMVDGYLNIYPVLHHGTKHQDLMCDVVALVYLHRPWEPEHEGYTVFFSEDDWHYQVDAGMPYSMNMAIFDGRIPHMATPFTEKAQFDRITLALKLRYANRIAGDRIF